MAEGGFGARGVYMGRDLLGGAFAYDPFELYRAGVITNPNMVVLGQIGRGKSAFVKTYLWRQAAFGRQAWVVDPKGEYGPLAAALGVEPIRLRPGGPARLNPLRHAQTLEEPGSGAAPFRSALVASLAEASLGRALHPRERTAIDLGLATLAGSRGEPTLPRLVEALLEPSPEAAARVRTPRAALAEEGREVALELRRLVDGDLQGMFDGPTTVGIDLTGPLVVLDLSAVYASAALGILMTCAAAWFHAALSRPGGGGRILVVDEAWAVLASLPIARWLRASWKLARAHGVANVAVLHRLSDLSAAGVAGSEQVGAAQGLLSDSETRVVYAQPPGELERCADLLALSATEAGLLPRLGRGVALWKVAHRSFLVEHRLARAERQLVDTDAHMAGRP
jgi:type IV secretory pathway VirB4 component